MYLGLLLFELVNLHFLEVNLLPDSLNLLHFSQFGFLLDLLFFFFHEQGSLIPLKHFLKDVDFIVGLVKDFGTHFLFFQLTFICIMLFQECLEAFNSQSYINPLRGSQVTWVRKPR